MDGGRCVKAARGGGVRLGVDESFARAGLARDVDAVLDERRGECVFPADAVDGEGDGRGAEAVGMAVVVDGGSAGSAEGTHGGLPVFDYEMNDDIDHYTK